MNFQSKIYFLKSYNYSNYNKINIKVTHSLTNTLIFVYTCLFTQSH